MTTKSIYYVKLSLNAELTDYEKELYVNLTRPQDLEIIEDVIYLMDGDYDLSRLFKIVMSDLTSDLQSFDSSDLEEFYADAEAFGKFEISQVYNDFETGHMTVKVTTTDNIQDVNAFTDAIKKSISRYVSSQFKDVEFTSDYYSEEYDREYELTAYADVFVE